jgi:hypothetical protein
MSFLLPIQIAGFNRIYIAHNVYYKRIVNIR